MFLLPHILYVFRALPIPFLSAHLKKLQNILNKLICRGKRPRIKATSLLCPTKLTGLVGPGNLLEYIQLDNSTIKTVSALFKNCVPPFLSHDPHSLKTYKSGMP